MCEQVFGASPRTVTLTWENEGVDISRPPESQVAANYLSGGLAGRLETD